MIAVDTNVLVRLLVQDDEAQAGKARQLLDRQARIDASIWIADTVLVELVWTLARAYGRTRAELAQVVRALTQHATVTLESEPAVRQALELFEQHGADFADCLLAAKAANAGCEQLVTFDKGMKKLPHVHLI